MILQTQDDSFLAVVFILTAIVIPFVVLWFDDGMIHSNNAKK